MSAVMPRRVEPELLDGLKPGDPRARRSREDLRRLHRMMATLSIVEHALARGTSGFSPRHLLELGAGDGSLLLRLARRRGARWPGIEVTLLDQVDVVPSAVLDGLRQAGWKPGVLQMEVFDWLASPDHGHRDVIFANLFVHHFSAADLPRLLAGIAGRTRVFHCCEPRRSRLPLAASHLARFAGAGPVTRQDAVSSVHAGFRDRELSALWPDHERWTLDEGPAGLFSHSFLAVRKEA